MPIMYILECSSGTGSTRNLPKRLHEHETGEGANYTKKHLPVNLVYCEEYSRVSEAFYREKQVQRWSHAKKKALIERKFDSLNDLSACKNITHYKRIVPRAKSRGT